MDEPLSCTGRVEAVEIIATEFLIRGRVAHHGEDDDQNLMGEGHDRFSPSSPGLDAIEERPQVTGLAMRCRPGSLCRTRHFRSQDYGHRSRTSP